MICGVESVSSAEEVSWTDNAALTGTLETEWAGMLDDGSTQKLETILQPELNVSLTGDSSLTGILRIRGDAEDKLEPGVLIRTTVQLHLVLCIWATM